MVDIIFILLFALDVMTFPVTNDNFTLLIGCCDCDWGCISESESDSDDSDDSDDDDDDSSFFKISLLIEFIILYCLYDNVICSLFSGAFYIKFKLYYIYIQYLGHLLLL